MINFIKPEASELQAGFEKIFVSPHLSDVKILETLTILRTKFEEMDKNKRSKKPKGVYFRSDFINNSS